MIDDSENVKNLVKAAEVFFWIIFANLFWFGTMLILILCIGCLLVCLGHESLLNSNLARRVPGVQNYISGLSRAQKV